MTLEEARQLILQAERVKLTVLTVYAQRDHTGGYSLIVEPVEGGKQIFPDALWLDLPGFGFHSLAWVLGTA
jgi:hypothetical protein